MKQEEFMKELQKAIDRLEETQNKPLIVGHPDAIKPIKDYFGDKYEYSTRFDLDTEKIYIVDKNAWYEQLKGGAE